MSTTLMDNSIPTAFGSGPLDDPTLTKKRPLDEDRESRRKKKKTRHSEGGVKKNKHFDKDEVSEDHNVIPRNGAEEGLSDGVTKGASESVSAATQAPGSSDSLIFLETFSLYLPLAPICQDRPLEALCSEHLSPLLLTYFQPFRGVVLGYENLRFLSGQYSRAQVHAIVSSSATTPSGHYSSLDEGEKDEVAPVASIPIPTDPEPVYASVLSTYGPTAVWVTADFILFRPRIGAWMEGSLNLQTESHLSVVCWNLFNASIDRSALPSDWEWVPTEAEAEAAPGEDLLHSQPGTVAGAGRKRKYHGGAGHYVDGSGEPIRGPLRFRILDFDSVAVSDQDSGILSIEGSLLTVEQEKEAASSAGASGNEARGSYGFNHTRNHKNSNVRTSQTTSTPSSAAIPAVRQGTHVKF